jgi:hypothetical protein
VLFRYYDQNVSVLAVLAPASNFVAAQINVYAGGCMTIGTNTFVLAVILVSAQINSNHFKILKCKTKIKNIFTF